MNSFLADSELATIDAIRGHLGSLPTSLPARCQRQRWCRVREDHPFVLTTITGNSDADCRTVPPALRTEAGITAVVYRRIHCRTLAEEPEEAHLEVREYISSAGWFSLPAEINLESFADFHAEGARRFSRFMSWAADMAEAVDLSQPLPDPPGGLE